MENEEFPMRINKYLAWKRYASRREADGMIKQGQVKINGRVAALGDKVQATDKVEVSAGDKKRLEKLVYFAYNKPVGIVTHSAEADQEEIEDAVDVGVPVFPVGRLDRESHGLIILTNDGRITDQLLNPKYEHEKDYVVRVNKPLRQGFIKKMEIGIQLDTFTTKPAKVKQLEDKVFRITLTEGKKHQIRRMCDAFGYTALDLERIRIMSVSLGRLNPGQYRKLEGEELSRFLESLGLK